MYLGLDTVVILVAVCWLVAYFAAKSAVRNFVDKPLTILYSADMKNISEVVKYESDKDPKFTANYEKMKSISEDIPGQKERKDKYFGELYGRINKNAAIMNHFAHSTDSGFDIYYFDPDGKDVEIPAHSRMLLSTGVKICLPENHELQIRPKSGHSCRARDVCWGTVDNSYRKEIKVNYVNNTDKPIVVQNNTKVAQGVIAKLAYTPKRGDRFVLVNNECISDTGRGGFGSTGND